MASLSAETLKRKQERNQRLIAQLRSKTLTAPPPTKTLAVITEVPQQAVLMSPPTAVASPHNGNASWDWSSAVPLEAKEIIPGQHSGSTRGLLHVQASMRNTFLDGSRTYSEWFAWLSDFPKEPPNDFEVALQKKEQFQAIDVGLALKVGGKSVLPQVWTLQPEITRYQHHYAGSGELELSVTRH